MNEPVLTLSGIIKRFGRVEAVANLSLEIAPGELFTLLGPSGCGKTTTLRMIAGLEKPDAGEILLKGRPIASPRRRVFIPPEKRNMGMVFQSYAIWPNMTVFQNVAYPLELRRVKPALIRQKVLKVLSLVGLEGMEDRLAPHLSGGQQQRVALARALVYEPEILLLDEPLSNLDAKLREQMRVELKLLQQRLGITLVYVTHDQLEALSLSDRIAVLNHGKVEQQGKARDLYENPQTPFVRDFLGKTVILRGKTGAVGPSRVTVELNGTRGTPLRCPCHEGSVWVSGQEVYISVRPEDVVVRRSPTDPSDPKDNILQGTVEALLFVGDRSECQVRVGDEKILVYVPRHEELESGQAISLYLPMEAVNMWPV